MGICTGSRAITGPSPPIATLLYIPLPLRRGIELRYRYSEAAVRPVCKKAQ